MERELAEGYRLMDMMSTQDGVLSVGPTRMILLSAKAYTFLVKSIHEHAPHAVKFLLYDVGYQVGADLMSTLQDLTKDKEVLLRYAVEAFKQAGYGDFQLAEFDLDKPYVRILGENLFEAGLAAETGIHRSARTVDDYSRGMFAGFFSHLLGTEVVCEEMSCTARGDATCEFVIVPFTVEGGSRFF